MIQIVKLMLKEGFKFNTVYEFEETGITHQCTHFSIQNVVVEGKNYSQLWIGSCIESRKSFMGLLKWKEMNDDQKQLFTKLIYRKLYHERKDINS